MGSGDNNEQQQREREIFEAAIRLPADEQAAHVARVCGGDAELERRVQRLLAAHDHANEAPSRIAPPPSAVPLDPTTIGSYRVLERIGEGGMSIVYLAEQIEPVRRRVAVKVIKLGMDTKEVIARFESERQAMALMNHPGIARMLDVGATEQGRPFFVMEYVPGVSITEYCDKMRLGVDARLELFHKVCLAVQHAHQKGVIHRDIKPSNILVSEDDGRPVPKVIDFGVAKATDHRLSELTLYTRIGYLIGTPEYMSPEQAEMSPLNVDTRSDVYSLGAVLYELLVSVRPLEFPTESPGQGEIQKMIRTVEPDSPSNRLTKMEPDEAATAAHRRSSSYDTLRRKLRGELGWITAAALTKDPARRYQAAQSLAQDVERYLTNKPVNAGPESLVYRSRKFVRRHRGALASASVVLVALLASLVVSSLGFLEARRERDLAEAVTQFLADMLAAADPAELGKDVTVRQVLDQTSTTISEQFSDRPLIEAKLRGTIGDTYFALGLLDEAEVHLLRELTIHEAHLAAEDPVRLDAQHHLAWLYSEQGRYEEAERLALDTLEKRRKVLGYEHRDTLNSTNHLALLYVELGRFEDAEPLHLIDYQTSLSEFGPEDPDTLIAMNNLARLYVYQGRYDEAESLHLQEYRITRRILGDEHPDTITSVHNIGALYERRQAFDQAAQWYEKALADGRRILGEDHPKVLSTRINLGGMLANAGKYADAQAMLQQALESGTRALGSRHPGTLRASAALGRAFLLQGHPERAEPHLRHAVEQFAKTQPDDSPWMAIYRAEYGRCLLQQRRYAEAEPLLLAAHAVLSTVADSRVLTAQAISLNVLQDLVELYENSGRPEEATRYRPLLAERDIK